MQIKKRLQINVAVSMVMALVICLVLFLSLYRLNKANNLAKISGEIVSSVLERVTLRNDYIRNNIARAKEQWFAKQEQIGGLLKSASENFQSDADRTNITELIEHHESIGKIFMAIAVNREKRGLRPGSTGLSREVEDRLLSQLNMRVYEVVLHSRKLLDSSRKARDSALRLAGWGIISVLLILIVVALFNSRIMSKAIIDPVQRLREDASVFGAGNLDHRIDVKGDDEIADLSNAFNAMAAKLHGLYQDFENEIKERKRAEEALLVSEERLRFALETSHTGAWDLDLKDHTAYRSHEHDRIFGYAELLPQWTYEMFLEHVLPDDRAVVDEKFRHATRTQSDWTSECRILRADGEVRWILAAGRHRLDALGNIRRIAGIVQDITERKQAEETLRKAHVELELRVQERTQKLMEAEAATRLANVYNRSLIEVSLDPLVTISAEGKITDVNAETEAATGCARAELIDTDFSDYFTEPEKARAGYEQVFRTGSVRNYELELRHRDGRTTPVLYNASVYRDEQGNVLGVFAAAHDITEQKQAQKTLSELNELLEQRVAERTAELHAANETLRASRVAALNLMEDVDAARRQAEKSRAELQGEVVERKRTQNMLITLNKDLENRIFQRTRFYSLLAAVNAEIVRQHDQQALFNEVCRIIVETGRFKLAWVGLVDPENRQVHPVSSHGATAYLEGIKIVAADTPEGRGPTGMAIVEGRHISNPDFENDEKMAPWRERARLHGIRSSSAFPLRLGNQVIGALTIYSDQPSFFTADEVALLLSLSENLSFAIAAFEVEKERRAAVDALKKLNEDLELRVAHRTAALEFSNRELEAFIYSVSHDLRAPLRHISGFTKIIAEDYTDKFDEQGKEHLARIHNGAERMANLIEDLLRLSRVSRQEMERETVDMSAIVSSLVADFREVNPDGSREVIINQKISASVDRRLIKLALQNLVENAWKFTSKTQDPRIEFDAFEQEGKTVYRIRDNGVGFDPAYAGKMFMPFHRLHTESEFQGSGIGLAIVERVVQRHGGRIWAEGEVGKGATIYFTLE